MKTSLVSWPSFQPPNKTAVLSFIMVRENPRQGGGLVPLTTGKDHLPEEVEGKNKITADRKQVNHIIGNI